MSSQPATPDPSVAAEAGAGTRPATTGLRTNPFARKHRPAPLAHDDARRQGDISQLAFLTMGGRDPAVAFLNAENPELGGRPLTVATASAEGYTKVAAAIRAWVPEAAAE